MSKKESMARAHALDAIAQKNNEEKAKVQIGTDAAAIQRTAQNKARILAYFGANEADWNSYAWQLKNRIKDAQTLAAIMQMDAQRYQQIQAVSEENLWSISPYYLSLVDFEQLLDPIGLICIPNISELAEGGEADPMAEESTSPASYITRRYPDRIILNVTNACGMYCRFCQRKRHFAKIESQRTRNNLDHAIEYISNTPSIRDVLITGGDPLTLSTPVLEGIIAQIKAIAHVEIIRIGTRIPVTIPQRIDNALVDMLKKYHPIYINTHFNHPRELTAESMAACEKLANAGIPLGNQSVLLNGVNNNKYTFLRLNQGLLRCRVRPYYIFQAKKVMGTLHFNCDINEGIEIVNFLRGNTSGLAIPQFIVNAPKGLGKITLHKKNYDFPAENIVRLQTWEGVTLDYPNYPTSDPNTWDAPGEN